MSVHIVFETPQDVQEQVYEMVKSLGKDGKGRLKKGANEGAALTHVSCFFAI